MLIDAGWLEILLAPHVTPCRRAPWQNVGRDTCAICCLQAVPSSLGTQT